MGNYTITVNDWSIDLINRILSEDSYQKLKTAQHWIDFREQAAWYTLTGTPSHSWTSFFELDNWLA